jgi:hypothetical protein
MPEKQDRESILNHFTSELPLDCVSISKYLQGKTFFEI